LARCCNVPMSRCTSRSASTSGSCTTAPTTTTTTLQPSGSWPSSARPSLRISWCCNYQPKADLRERKVTAVEALVRWNHPTRGLLYPDAFLPAAEQTELVDPLTRWVLRTATAALPSVDPTGQLAIAVNISARNLIRADFADDVLNVLRETGTDPRRVILEITETALVLDPARAARTLGRLHDVGVRISIDDFGAGQTSLGYLGMLPITELKIDKAFVLSMLNDERNAAIVRSVIELGHNLGVTVTAEGVETAEALDYLAACDCDTVQGFLLARPTDIDAVRRQISQVRNALCDHQTGVDDFSSTSAPPQHVGGLVHEDR